MHQGEDPFHSPTPEAVVGAQEYTLDVEVELRRYNRPVRNRDVPKTTPQTIGCGLQPLYVDIE